MLSISGPLQHQVYVTTMRQYPQQQALIMFTCPKFILPTHGIEFVSYKTIVFFFLAARRNQYVSGNSMAGQSGKQLERKLKARRRANANNAIGGLCGFSPTTPSDARGKVEWKQRA